MEYGLAGGNPKSSGNKVSAGAKHKCMENQKIPATIPGDSPPSKLAGQSSGAVQHARSGAKNKTENMSSMPKNSGSKGFRGEGGSGIKYS